MLKVATRCAPFLGVLVLACTSAAPAPRNPPMPPGSSQPSAPFEEEPDTEEEEGAGELDSRIQPNNLKAQLPAYVASIGKGWGSGYEPTGALLVTASGQRLLTHLFGRANYAEGRANALDTPFALGSITQALTVTGLVVMEQQGLLELSDRLGKHLPECRGPAAKASLAALVEGQAGLGRLGPYKQAQTPEELRALAQQICEQSKPIGKAGAPTSRAPRASFVLLQAVMEKVSSQQYADWMDQNVLRPLGLQSSSFYRGGEPEGAAVRYGVSARDGERERLPEPHLVPAAEGLFASALDTGRWLRAITRSDALSDEQKARLVGSRSEASLIGDTTDYRGLRVIVIGGGSRSAMGPRSVVLLVPELELSVIALSNSTGFDAQPVAQAALGAALGEAVEPLKPRAEYELDPDTAERIRGAYFLGEEALAELEAQKIPAKVVHAMQTVSIFLNDEQLFFKPAGRGAVRMVPNGPSSFVLRGGRATLEVDINFEHPDETRLILRQSPLEVEYTRKPARKPKVVEHELVPLEMDPEP